MPVERDSNSVPPTRSEPAAHLSKRRLFRAAAAMVVVIGLVAGFDLFGRRVRIDARSDWESLSPDLREAGRKDALAGPGHLRLRLPGLLDDDSVELTLASRPGLGPLWAEASRGRMEPLGVAVDETAVIIRLPPGRGSELVLDVTPAADAARRPVYLFHLLEIVVLRKGLWPSVRPLVPALVGFALLGLFRRSRGMAAPLWALLGVTVMVALTPDPVASVASDGRWVWLCGLVTLMGGMRILSEPHWRVLPKAVLGAGLVLFVAVMAHVPRLNGPPNWEWPWQRLDCVTTFGAVLAASLPLFAARALHRTRGPRLSLLLALIAAGTALSATASMAVQPTGLDRMHRLIESSVVTSYYTDALDLAAEPGWMASYPQRLPSLHLHTKTKPAGPVLFYVALIHAFGPGSITAAIGGLLIAFGAALAVPAVYLLARELGESSAAAFEAACVMALSPSLLLFFPEFDQVFALITCVLLASWCRAVNGSVVAALVVGLAASLATFFSYSLMTLGVAGLVIAARALGPAFRAAAWAGLVALAAYASLYAASRFDPIATFRTAVANQARSSADLGRDYLSGLLNDPWDFAMGAGWLWSVLASIAVVRAWRTGKRTVPALLAVLQLGAVYGSGLLSVETARVWLFLVPLVAIPAGRELAGWAPGERTAACVMMVLLAAALVQNMTFLF